MPAKQPGMTEDFAARVPSREVVAAEISRQLGELVVHDDEADETESTPIDRLTEMMRETGDGKARVKVYRQDNHTKVFEFCCEYMPEQFEEGGLDMLRRDWGPGVYQLKLYATHPTSNKFVIRATQSVTLARMNSIAPTAAVGVAGSNDALAAVLATISEGQTRLLEALTNRPQVDPIAQLTQTLGLMTTMREAMGINNAPQQKSSIGEIVEAIKELKGVQTLIGGAEEKEPASLLSLAPQVLDTIKTLGIGQQQQAAQVNSQPFPALGIPASMQATSEPAEAAEMPLIQPPQPATAYDLEDPEMLKELLFFANVKKLAKMAEAQGDIEEAGELIVDEFPDELFDALKLDNWFESLQAIAPQYLPALAPHLETRKEWLTKVRDHALKLLQDEG